MSFCSKCGEKNSDDARFCKSCGAEIESQNSETETKMFMYLMLQ